MANFREGVKTPTKFSKWGTFTGPQHLEGVAGKEGGEFFQGGGGCSFYIQNKPKSEIFNDEKSYEQEYFSVINKSSNW